MPSSRRRFISHIGQCGPTCSCFITMRAGETASVRISRRTAHSPDWSMNALQLPRRANSMSMPSHGRARSRRKAQCDSTTRRNKSDHLAGVENALGVQRVLQSLHEGKFRR